MTCVSQGLRGPESSASLKLPEWLQALMLEGQRVGEATVSPPPPVLAGRIGSIHHEVLACEGSKRIVRQPSPWLPGATHGERFRDFLSSLLPGNGPRITGT